MKQHQATASLASRIAEDHRTLKKIIGDIAQSANSDSNSTMEILDHLKAVLRIAESHFRDEETLMLNLGYPKRWTHMVNHEWFLKTLREYISALECGDIMEDGHTLQHIPNWLGFYLTCRDDELEAWVDRRTHTHRWLAQPARVAAAASHAA